MLNQRFEDITEQVREAHWERVRKDYNRAINGNRFLRYFRACRWKYFSNEIYQGLVDAVWIGFGLGLICAVILGLSLFSNYTGS